LGSALDIIGEDTLDRGLIHRKDEVDLAISEDLLAERASLNVDVMIVLLQIFLTEEFERFWHSDRTELLLQITHLIDVSFEDDIAEKVLSNANDHLDEGAAAEDAVRNAFDRLAAELAHREDRLVGGHIVLILRQRCLLDEELPYCVQIEERVVV